MKSGDLVLCTFQPATACFTHLGYTEPMKYHIKGKFGFLVSKHREETGSWFVYFIDIGYTHILDPEAFEVISESR